MLSNPHFGWVSVTLGDFTDRASYLTNVPVNCLDALIFSIQTYKPSAVLFDAEGWEYVITFTLYKTYIVRSKNETEFFVIDKGVFEIAREVIDDFERDYNEWLDWDSICGGKDDYSLYKNNRTYIPEKLSKLKSLWEG